MKIKGDTMKKNVKTLLLMLIFLLGLFEIPMFASAQLSTGPNIQVSLVNQKPDPVTPGSYVTLRFIFTNGGMKSVDHLYVKLDNSYPFKVVGQETKEISGLAAAQTGSNGQIVSFLVQVDKNAYPGKIPISIEYSTDKQNWMKYDQAMINIESVGDNVLINRVDSSPSIVKPGQPFQFNLNIKNYGDSLVKNVYVSIDFTALLRSQDVQSGISLPILPLNSSIVKKINILSPGQDANLSFSLITASDAKASIYSLPIKITYEDSNGQIHQLDDLASVRVGGKPDMDVQFSETPILIVNNKGTVVLKVVDQGILDSKFVRLSISPTDNLQILSQKDQYIGDIDSDDYETESFDVFPKTSGELKLPVTITFSDALGNKFSQSKVLTLKVYSAEEAKQLGIIKTNKLAGVLVLLLVIVIGYILYKRFKK